MNKLKKWWYKLNKMNDLATIIIWSLAILTLLYSWIKLMRWKPIISEKATMWVWHIGTALAIIWYIVSIINEKDTEEMKSYLKENNTYLKEVLNILNKSTNKKSKARNSKNEINDSKILTVSTPTRDKTTKRKSKITEQKNNN